VQGWLGDDEAWAVHEAVRNHPSERAALTVVEIGSWKGRSTITLACGLRSRGGGTVHAIDPHGDSALHDACGGDGTYETFVANVRAAGVAPYVRAIRSLSTVARLGFAPRSVDVLFVDGSHEYEDVLRDIDDWTPALRDVATVGFHDARDEYPGVMRALNEPVACAGSSFGYRRLIEGTLLARFRRLTG
jgi:hypothetical protein